MKRVFFIAFAYTLANANEYELPVINVQAADTNSTLSSKQDKYAGTTSVTRTYIENLPATGGGITSILRTNPAIQYNTTQRNSTNAAEIDPDDISINGAPSWQNSFLIDGVNFNNDLNPRQSRYSAINSNFNSNAVLPDIGSISQGMNLDSELIESISVHDSFISAKYGGFEGGVVDVKTRDPRRNFHGKISTKYTSDSYTKQFIDPQQYAAFEASTNDRLQSKFKKRIYNVTLEGYLTENFGLLFSASQTRSSFLNYNTSNSSAYFPAGTAPRATTQRRRSDNYLLKGVWYVADYLKITPQILYTPAHSTHYNSFSKNGQFDIKTDGLIGGLDVEYDNEWLNFTNNFSYLKLQSSKDARSQNYITWPRTNHHNWGGTYSVEGAYGDIDQIQKTFAYKGEFSTQSVEILGLSHKFSGGLELAHKSGEYKIPGFILAGSAHLRPLNAGQNCAPGDTLCVDDITSYSPALPPNRFSQHGAFFHKYSLYKGEAKVDMNEYGAWLQDEIEIGKLSTRFGVRAESETYFNNTNIAPRFSTSYDVFGDDTIRLNFGLNRYYGRNIFAYALRNAMNSLQSTCQRGEIYDPANANFICSGSGNKPRYAQANDLDTPYNDEMAFSIGQKIGNTDATFKFIKRYGRDEVRSKSYFNMPNLFNPMRPNPNYNPAYDSYYFEYNNDGKSRSDIYELKLASVSDFTAFGAQNGFELTFNYTDTKRNYNTEDNYLERDFYEFGVDGTPNRTDLVMLDGSVINRNDLPSTDFNEPWAIKASTMSKFGVLSLGFTKMRTNLANFFSYRGSHESIMRVGNATYDGGEIAKYETVKFGKAFNWDARLGFEFSAPKNSAFFANLEIYNVLNRKVIAGKYHNETSRRTYTYYEPGRQFWFEFGYKW